MTGGRIEAIGSLAGAQAGHVIDATGQVVAPGFIDIHTHADIALLARPSHEPKVMQGVTTEVFSNCGLGFAPVTAEALAIQREYLLGLFGDDRGVAWNWRSVAEFLDRYRGGIATNAVYLIPHGAVRVSVMGMADRPATAEELAAMVALVRRGMEEGARGLSSGLWYAPMSYAAPEEPIALCRAVAEYGGFFAIHMRDYGDRIIDALEEAIRIGEAASVPVQVSHLQTTGASNRGRSDEILETIEAARTRGVDVTCDSYPYLAGSTLVQALLPTWAVAVGPAQIMARLADAGTRERVEAELAASPRDWARVHLCGAQSAANRRYEREAFSTIAAARGLPVAALVCALLEEEALQACFICHQSHEEDLRAILTHPSQMVGSDGLHLPGKTHPRLYGTFPRLIARYVREEPVLTLEAAIHKMTGAPAARLGLRDRGRLEVGAAADLVLFDPATIRDTATYEDPCRYPEGIPLVLVNGVPVKEDDQHTGALAGEVIA